MPKRKEPELDPKEQFKRFMKTARDHGVDESGKDFERVFRKVVPPHPRNKVSSKESKNKLVSKK